MKVTEIKDGRTEDNEFEIITGLQISAPVNNKIMEGTRLVNGQIYSPWFSPGLPSFGWSLQSYTQI
jgi:hypothetical protein